MDITLSGESIYFWENGIGRVHRYDVATGNMIREDTSHQHRTMFRHAPFLSGDNYIYAIGGYGYWEMRNFLIRYEPEFGQWEKIPSKNDGIVIRDWGGLLYKVGDTFYYFFPLHFSLLLIFRADYILLHFMIALLY
ncbi:kelch repeat-containing protein [Rhodohalobacter sp. 8-1]|uniref:kelch repeat-containing protein n=1 Tax=Rhodohalobacter sp. 8-1 TaxID=3131972 RepID=UPI0030ED26D6